MNTPESGPARLRVKLFDVDDGDCEIDADAIDLDALGEHQLLWVDIEDNRGEDTAAIVDQLVRTLRLEDGADALRALDGKPTLQNFDAWFLVEVVAVECPAKLQFEGRGLAIVCGRNFVVSLHRGTIEFIDELHARELGVGSFELFTTRSAQRTNDTMRVLTFVTVLLGTLAVIAGAMGMNFKAPLFETGAAGFWWTIAGMALIGVVATVVARWRKWM